MLYKESNKTNEEYSYNWKKPIQGDHNQTSGLPLRRELINPAPGSSDVKTQYISY